MVKRETGVPRPRRSTDYVLAFGTRDAEKGWRDVVATQRNAVVDAWDRLTARPLDEDPRCHRLRGEPAHVVRDGTSHEQRQYELTGGARIWFYVEAKTKRVVLVRVFTAHPSQTK